MVEGLAHSLRQHQYDVWIDFKDIAGGEKWESEIKKALEISDFCLVALTPDAVASSWVKREIELAQHDSKSIIPLIMREIPLPNSLQKLGIADLQHIDFVRYGLNSGIDQLINALKKLNSKQLMSTNYALVIEDVTSHQTAIEQVMKLFELEVKIANDFDSALELIRSEKFVLITLDMQLGQMDLEGQNGLLLLDELHTYQKNVPIIIISALKWTGRDVRDFLRKHHAFDFLAKPFKLNELRSIVSEALRQKK